MVLFFLSKKIGNEEPSMELF